jgi:glycosyltransferase involved in cell wall biosynthesis
MKILFSHYLSYQHHPAAVWVEEASEALRARGHEVLVHRSFGRPIEPPSGNESGGGRRILKDLEARLRGRLWFAKSIVRNRAMQRRDQAALQEYKPDIVLARQDSYCVSMPRAAARLGIPLVTLADAPVAYESRLYAGREGRWHPPGLVERMERWTLRHSHAVVTISHPAARRLAMYGVNVPIHVVANGVDPERFPVFDPEERQRRRRQLGITAPRVAGFVGTFKAFHGIDRLATFVGGTSGRTDTQWLLIGGGPELPRIQHALRDCPRVIFLGPRRAQEVGPLLALIDVAVAPHAQMKGDFYFCPMKILEYGIAGCAIVAGAQGDIPQMLDHGRVGVVMTDFSDESWIHAIHALLDEPDRTTTLGREARRWVLDHYTWSHTVASIERVLANVLVPS